MSAQYGLPTSGFQGYVHRGLACRALAPSQGTVRADQQPDTSQIRTFSTRNSRYRSRTAAILYRHWAHASVTPRWRSVATSASLVSPRFYFWPPPLPPFPVTPQVWRSSRKQETEFSLGLFDETFTISNIEICVNTLHSQLHDVYETISSWLRTKRPAP